MSFINAFSGFSVENIEDAKVFYEQLGCRCDINEMGILAIELPGGANAIAYPKPDHHPADFTILNLVTEDLASAIDVLTSKGCKFERYEGFEQDDRGIAQNAGPLIAWTKDPSGNVVALMQS